MKVYYPKLYNMAHLLALNVLLLPKDLTIIFIHPVFSISFAWVTSLAWYSQNYGPAGDVTFVALHAFRTSRAN